VLETGHDVGGTWYWNRYPGARFDTESMTYGYSFSKSLLQEWDWKERFSAQPENLRYLQYVTEKFDLRKHMQFGVKVEAATWDEAQTLWRLRLDDGRRVTTRFLITAIGLLSAQTVARYEGVDEFAGLSFHTRDWPEEPVELSGKRVAVIGTGSSGVQVIQEIAEQVGELTVFQRRPNWCVPLHNAEISAEEMADIKQRYDEIYARCDSTNAGFIHDVDYRPFYEVPREERLAKWEKLYASPGFGLWLGNFIDIYTDEQANAEASEFVADKIRSRVTDPVVAEKLIPKDHGFGMQRPPMETNYYEVYNRDNVRLVDLQETPIERITPTGIRTTEHDYDFDIIVYATGFDASTGAYDRIDFRGVGGLSLRDKWDSDIATYFGMMVWGFPNMIMPIGPQSASATTNYPRGIATGVDWVTGFVEHMLKHGHTRAEPTLQAEQNWRNLVASFYPYRLIRKAQSWWVGYNSNVEGHEKGSKMRYLMWQGGAVKYRTLVAEAAEKDYEGVEFN
jgi:cation diffusion facilitator CzcD-associated flavoprotein CzcO